MKIAGMTVGSAPNKIDDCKPEDVTSEGVPPQSHLISADNTCELSTEQIINEQGVLVTRIRQTPSLDPLPEAEGLMANNLYNENAEQQDQTIRMDRGQGQFD